MVFTLICRSVFSRPKVGALVLVLCLASFTINAVCQETTGPQEAAAQPTSHVRPIPLPLLYWQFLAYQNHLDRAAATLEKQGKDGTWLSDHFQRKLGFTDEQFAQVRNTGLRLESKLQKINAKAEVVIQATRAKYPHATMSQPETLPPVPPELIRLQKEHDQIIQNEVTNLKGQLGPAASAKLDSFLQQQFSRTVTTRTVQLPRHAHDPAHNPVPPFSQEATK